MLLLLAAIEVLIDVVPIEVEVEVKVNDDGIATGEDCCRLELDEGLGIDECEDGCVDVKRRMVGDVELTGGE